MTKSYRIIKIVFNSVSGKIQYVIVEGSRGKRTILDRENILSMLDNNIPNITSMLNIDNLVYKTANIHGASDITHQVYSEESLKAMAKYKNYNLISKIHNRTAYYTLNAKLDLDWIVEGVLEICRL